MTVIKEVIATGKDIDEARANAAEALGADELADIKYEILDLGKRGFLGFGASLAKVKASVELPDPENAPRSSYKSGASDDRRNSRQRDNRQRNDRQSARRQNNRKDRQPSQSPSSNAQAPVSRLPEAELKYEPKTVSEGDDLSFDFINQLIANLGIEANASLFVCPEGGRKIIIGGKDSSILIGHHGETLDALQYLTNLASTKKNKNGERNRGHVVLDIEGYRAKREEALRTLARRMARKALKNNRNVTLEPMSAYERRIIHSEIQGMEGVSTSSVGSDENRKVVIYVIDRKPAEAASAEAAQATVSSGENE